MNYKTGDRVKKLGGTYQGFGTIKAVWLADDGSDRYAFRFDVPAGQVHIFNAANLQPMTWIDKLKVFVLLAVVNLLRL